MDHANNEITIAEYPDLTKAADFIYRWLPDFSFRFDPVSKEQWQCLARTAGLEVHFTDPRADHLGFIADFVVRSGRSSDLIVVEHRSSPRSRSRSYKGIFFNHPAIRSGEYVEVEVDLAAPYTHFVGVARLSPESIHECLELLGDSARAFIVLSDTKRPLRANLAERIIKSVPRLPGAAYVDYASLVSTFCPERSWILRMAGYSGEGDAFVQLFLPRVELATVKQIAENTIKAAEI